METIDSYLGRADVACRDMRMVGDPVAYEDIGGSSLLDFVLEGFKLVPFPYIGTLQALPVDGAYEVACATRPAIISLQALPVDGAYEGPRLFDVEWADDGTVAEATPRYEESQLIVEDLFPKDRPVIVMCGGGGCAGMMRQLLINLGWDPQLVYNAGGAWSYTGYRAVPLVRYDEDDDDQPRFCLWRADVATIDFDQYRPLA